VLLALGDHAASRHMSGAVMQVSHGHVYARRHAAAPRRYNWQYNPYWRPYHYYYWQAALLTHRYGALTRYGTVRNDYSSQ
jgi:hypothetical protein